jgi:hypothetical protein
VQLSLSGLQCNVLPQAGRAAIRDAVGNWSTVSYWLDLGNNADSGQFILGEPLNVRNRKAKLRLRSAAELFPEIVDPNLDNDEEPSCSSAEAGFLWLAVGFLLLAFFRSLLQPATTLVGL